MAPWSGIEVGRGHDHKPGERLATGAPGRIRARALTALEAVIREIEREREVSSANLDELLLDLQAAVISLGGADLGLCLDETTIYIRRLTRLFEVSPFSEPSVNRSVTVAEPDGTRSVLDVVVDRCTPQRAEAVRERVRREGDIDVANVECDTLAIVARALIFVTNPVGESIDISIEALARRKDAHAAWNLVAFLFVGVDSYAANVAGGTQVGKDVAGTLLRQLPIIAEIRRVAQAVRVLG